jgi:hypothetical protein
MLKASTITMVVALAQTSTTTMLEEARELILTTTMREVVREQSKN